MQETKNVNRYRNRGLMAGIIIILLIVLAVLWFFTPLSFIGVKSKGEYRIKIEANGYEMYAVMEDNTSSWALHRMLEHGSKTLNMNDYGNMEKLAMLGRGLPRNDEQISVEAGDIILYLGSTLTIYYNTNSYTFTKLGHIENISQQELKSILGDGDVRVTLSLAEK